MKNKNDVLKTLAQQAKDRLKNRNYDDSQTIKASIRKNFRIYEGGLRADYKLVLINKQEDEEFYVRVKNILDENADIINPIGTLVDKNKFSNMSRNEQERYVFMLADKYREMKKRYEKEILAESILS